MRAKAVGKLTRNASPLEIPYGRYDGTWGGYELKFNVGGYEYYTRLDKGIRTPSTPCYVFVEDNSITVEVKKD